MNTFKNPTFELKLILRYALSDAAKGIRRRKKFCDTDFFSSFSKLPQSENNLYKLCDFLLNKNLYDIINPYNTELNIDEELPLWGITPRLLLPIIEHDKLVFFDLIEETVVSYSYDDMKGYSGGGVFAVTIKDKSGREIIEGVSVLELNDLADLTDRIANESPKSYLNLYARILNILKYSLDSNIRTMSLSKFKNIEEYETMLVLLSSFDSTRLEKYYGIPFAYFTEKIGNAFITYSILQIPLSKLMLYENIEAFMLELIDSKRVVDDKTFADISTILDDIFSKVDTSFLNEHAQKNIENMKETLCEYKRNRIYYNSTFMSRLPIKSEHTADILIADSIKPLQILVVGLIGYMLTVSKVKKVLSRTCLAAIENECEFILEDESESASEQNCIEAYAFMSYFRYHDALKYIEASEQTIPYCSLGYNFVPYEVIESEIVTMLFRKSTHDFMFEKYKNSYENFKDILHFIKNEKPPRQHLIFKGMFAYSMADFLLRYGVLEQSPQGNIRLTRFGNRLYDKYLKSKDNLIIFQRRNINENQ